MFRKPVTLWNIQWNTFTVETPETPLSEEIKATFLGRPTRTTSNSNFSLKTEHQSHSTWESIWCLCGMCHVCLSGENEGDRSAHPESSLRFPTPVGPQLLSTFITTAQCINAAAFFQNTSVNFGFLTVSCQGWCWDGERWWALCSQRTPCGW